ncbi:hypothetical protein LWC33_16185 [Pseudonocardia sp. RS11V-5]|uniref:hypothetical protein n=1 Tax=Pseudonocardia terrae TaxID=2905831 RepID=UPI001E4FC2C9|nr:hypothetical protein [Pseudonocardia terrae]MCE3552990.1 hypothetical protein [Pseudonocardia terrae]
MGASNQWFARTLSALAVPRTGESELAAKVAELWLHLETCPRVALPYARANVEPLKFGLAEWSDEIWEAMDSHRAHLDIAEDGTAEEGFPDLQAEEWAIFAASRHPAPTPDFTLHRQDVPAELSGHLDDLVQVERLREARALVGFTRLDAPDPEDPDSSRRRRWGARSISTGCPPPRSGVRGCVHQAA